MLVDLRVAKVEVRSTDAFVCSCVLLICTNPLLRRPRQWCHVIDNREGRELSMHPTEVIISEHRMYLGFGAQERLEQCCRSRHSETRLKSSTTIESRNFRIPSDLRRQPGYRPVSSKVGDHLRILLGVVVSYAFLGLQLFGQ
jgi:hypothetical protein